MRIGRPLSDWFAEFVEQVREARCGAAVAVGLAWPAASDGVGRRGPFAPEHP